MKSEIKPERKQIGIQVDVQLWRRFRAKAIEEGRQAGHMIEELIADYLDDRQPIYRQK